MNSGNGKEYSDRITTSNIITLSEEEEKVRHERKYVFYLFGREDILIFCSCRHQKTHH